MLYDKGYVGLANNLSILYYLVIYEKVDCELMLYNRSNSVADTGFSRRGCWERGRTSLVPLTRIRYSYFRCNVTGSRLLLYQKNMWLRRMCCLQIIWQENRKSQQRSWSAALPHGEDMVQAGCN